MAGTRPQRGVLKMVPFWDSHSKAFFGVPWASYCVICLYRSPKRVPNRSPKGVQNEVQTRVPLKTSKMWFRTLFATFQACPPCWKTFILGLCWVIRVGSPGRSTKEPLQNTNLKAQIVILEGQRWFWVPRGVPVCGKILTKRRLGRHALTSGVPNESKIAARRPQGSKLAQTVSQIDDFL